MLTPPITLTKIKDQNLGSWINKRFSEFNAHRRRHACAPNRLASRFGSNRNKQQILAMI